MGQKKVVSHFVGLSGIGGVQSNFTEYMKNVELHRSRYQHKIYTVGSINSQYQFTNKVLDIRKLSNLYRLILDIISRNVIVHFYNNLSSLKVASLLALLPVNKLIIHERGTIWSQKSTGWLIPRFIAWKASVILSNSVATKTMLEKKFSISTEKIRVLHNGINTSLNCGYCDVRKNNNSVFIVGFIGRLDSPKGAHVLIDSMNYLANKNIELIVAGEGVLESMLKKSASKLNNVKFIGRVDNPYSFISTIDLLVVPSIREPLGNVCLEAGLCKTPVLAANIDGIPEIIEDCVSGELIDPTDDITMDFPFNAVPLPEFVVDPVTYEIHTPLQINSKKLADKILELSLEEEILTGYSEQLHKRVVDYFNIDRYALELHRIYQGM